MNGVPAIVIADVPTEQRACEFFEVGKLLIKAIEAHYEPIEAQVRQLSKWIRDLKNQDLALVQPKVTALQAAIQDARGRRQAEEAEARARKRAQLETEAKAEQDRRAKALQAEAARARGQLKRDLLAQAKEVREESVVVSERAVAEAVPSSDPLMAARERKNPYRAEVVDFLKLVKAAVAEPDRYLKYLDYKQTELNKAARAEERDLRIPGVVAVQETTLI